ncbi:hypothetical protein [Sphingobacterium endophyticum]|nr:hypothetical protein [Sphingobacterium endophyticum]
MEDLVLGEISHGYTIFIEEAVAESRRLMKNKGNAPEYKFRT